MFTRQLSASHTPLNQYYNSVIDTDTYEVGSLLFDVSTAAF